MVQFEERCHILLQTADELLARYPKLRRRPGDSSAGRILYQCLPMLRGFGLFLPPEKCEKFLLMEEALLERYELLKARRVPPCAGLRQLRQQCRKLMLALPDIPPQWDAPSVLVGTLSSPYQLDTCLECNFYHVPARQVPEDWLTVSYVAIYQSRTMFPEDCGIRFYGRIKDCISLRRCQITEIPKDSDELYYRLEVDSWEQLETPVGVREVPFTHLLTNLFLLEHSRETPELLLKTPEDFLFYQALHRSLELGDGTVLRHPGGTVQHKKGLFQVHRRGRKIAAFTTEDFIRTPASIFRQLMKALKKRS